MTVTFTQGAPSTYKYLFVKGNLASAKPLGAGGGLSCPYVDKTKFINSYRLKKAQSLNRWAFLNDFLIQIAINILQNMYRARKNPFNCIKNMI